MSFGTKNKPMSACCDALAKDNVMNPGVSFCTKCGEDCEVVKPKPKYGASTLSNVRKTSGEAEVFRDVVWPRCKGKSEISGADLLPYGHPMWAAQFCHLLPKGSYNEDRLKPENIVATTVEEHTEEWPFVKEKTDAELREMGMSKWIPKVTVFRALRLKYHKRLKAELSGNA